ncbi:MAG: carboxypeptidase-like regulatory domain-containing protein [Planctomycetia bacterium]
MGTANARRRREDDWKPRIKGSRKKAAVVDSASAQSAQAAMANIKAIDRKVKRGIEVDGEFLEKVAKTLDPAAAERRQAEAVAAAAARSVPPLAIVGGLAAVCLLGVICFGMLGSSGHVVAGTVTLDGQPLPNVEVRFHPASLAAEEKELPPVRVTASPKGEFQIEHLPAGPYAITLHCGGDDASPIPDIYEAPSTTRFRVKLSQDVPNMNLLVSSKQPRR